MSAQRGVNSDECQKYYYEAKKTGEVLGAPLKLSQPTSKKNMIHRFPNQLPENIIYAAGSIRIYVDFTASFSAKGNKSSI